MRQYSHVSNPTGLVRIPKKAVSVRVHLASDGSYDSFDVTHLSLEGLDIDESANVWICAEAGDTAQNFSLGTVGLIETSGLKPLKDLNPKKPLRFRLLVFRDPDPRLIATCENLRVALTDEPDESLSVLPVRLLPLDVIWRMSLEEDNQPELLINDAPELQGGARIQGDPSFVAAILPEAIAQSVVHVFRNDPESDDNDHWANRWSRFITDIGGQYPPDGIDGENESQLREWASEIAGVFARKYKLTQILAKHLEKQND